MTHAKPMRVGIGEGIVSAKHGWTLDRHPAVADLDGDKKPDLAVANARSGTVSVLLNRF